MGAASRLAEETDALRPEGKAAFIYKPLRYAWSAHAEYIRRYAGGPKKVLLIGMNPGPWGMAQTGVPFGEINAVSSWLGILADVGTPSREHPKKRVEGFSCRRSEVSGRRLWSFFASRYGQAADFFQEHYVANYCPLLFLDEQGRNLTPDKLPKSAKDTLFQICDDHLLQLIRVFEPAFVLGIGRFAEQRARFVVDQLNPADPLPMVDSILHPSPANPKANQGWAEHAEAKLQELGIW